MRCSSVRGRPDRLVFCSRIRRSTSASLLRPATLITSFALLVDESCQASVPDRMNMCADCHNSVADRWRRPSGLLVRATSILVTCRSESSGNPDGCSVDKRPDRSGGTPGGSRVAARTLRIPLQGSESLSRQTTRWWRYPRQGAESNREAKVLTWCPSKALVEDAGIEPATIRL